LADHHHDEMMKQKARHLALPPLHNIIIHTYTYATSRALCFPPFLLHLSPPSRQFRYAFIPLFLPPRGSVMMEDDGRWSTTFNQWTVLSPFNANQYHKYCGWSPNLNFKVLNLK
jgi:hypothetical protein